MTLLWHRRDLRVPDNRGLARAAADGRVFAAFILDPDVLAHAGPPRVAFLLDALASLRADYRESGGDLVVRQGDPAAVLPDLAARIDADRVVWNRDYSGLARDRDERVSGALADAGIDFESRHDALLHEPGSILTNQGETYSVFSYFWKKWRDRTKDDPEPTPGSGDLAAPDDPGELPSLADLGVAEPAADLPDAGTAAARRRLREFCEGDVYRYADARDYPAERATSRLSQDLKYGTVGVREVWEATEGAMVEADGESERESVESFQRQLAWREFYAHVLENQPSVVTRNFKTYEREIPWRDDPDALRAWKAGDTGYPIVDAGMRQLRDEAWMHNRVRMLVAAFLTKDLLVDWRAGYDWFREKLVDHDTANDSGGWQWAASTGTDAQPYFRVFNPATQCEKYDPDAEYVHEHVPELRDASPDQIHRWPDLDAETRHAVAPDYPDPIVDHGEARERAIEAFEHARGG
jgi:deoxyribodipyrimidine photo-lyase